MIGGLLDDLRAESADLDALVADADWSLPTPAAGWTIGHQISHLAWTDRMSLLAIADPVTFEVALAEGSLDMVGVGAAEGVTLERWRAGRDDLAQALSVVPKSMKLSWFGPPMSAKSMATARIMETWAHGQDVADALGVTREPTDRLRHVAHIGVRTIPFAFLVNGREAPRVPVRVELTGPSGQSWTWGPADADERISGAALDFCLLVTQRRHRDDLDVTATGVVVQAWLPIAQAFAGPPGAGREKGPR